jgi:eukaryotic-like serine/threonine-protein kinase
MDPTMLAERYQLGELIATGGMGTVHRAMDTHLGRPVAVKILKRVLADDATFLERFRREARAAAVISHPGVARVYDYGELSSEPFIVMELVDGDTLAERIATGGPLPWQHAFAVAEQVAAALSAAHTHGVVHRDVKPANILIDRSGRVKVTDFGIARAARATTLTRPGMVLGSANYVAPEQAQGSTVGPAADLYSLGCVLFESVTGTTPYQGGSAVAIATQHVSAPVPDPREHIGDLPEPAARLIMRSLGKQPGDRFPSAAAMATALSDARFGRDPSAPSNDQTVSLPPLRLPLTDLPEESAGGARDRYEDERRPTDGPDGAGAAAGSAATGPSATGPLPGPSAITTSLPRTDAGSGRTVVRRGREAAPEGQGTPPMPWARVPGDLRPGGAGPGGPPGRLARAEHPGQRRSRRRTTWLLGLALGLVALLALPLVISRYSGEASTSQPAATSAPAGSGGGDSATLAARQVRLPDLRGERLDDATDKLRALDLEVVVLRGRGGGRRGVVVSMSPVPDSAVEHGSSVRLQVGRPGKDKGGDASEEDD